MRWALVRYRGICSDQSGKGTLLLLLDESEGSMIVLGIILLIIGFVFGISILWAIGIALLVIGAVLWLLGALGHAVGGRRHYW
ncbi:DUF6131 family protein [Microtetraspora fusca]|nr:DUF6131 family protein [Microtetraspora fusca]